MVRVTAEEDATLNVRLPAGSPEGDHIRLAEVGPHLFRQVDGELDAVFMLDDQGRVRHLAVEQFAFDRVSALRSPRVPAVIAVLAVVLFVGTLVGWLPGGAARLLGGATESPLSLPSRVVAGAVCLLGAIALAGVGYTLQKVSLHDLLIDVPLGLELLLAALLSSFPLTLALPYFALRGIQTDKPALLARAHYWILTGTALLTLAVAFHWNLLGFRY